MATSESGCHTFGETKQIEKNALISANSKTKPNFDVKVF